MKRQTLSNAPDFLNANAADFKRVGAFEPASDDRDFERGDESVELDDAPLDEEFAEIGAFLDGELFPEERDAFERRLESDFDLRRRVDEARAAWDALDLLSVDASNPNLTASTVERLDAETRSELTAIESADRLRRRSRRVLNGLVALLVAFLGFATFSVAFPDVQTRRERDCRVVERLAQLESAGEFEFLTKIAKTGLFDAPRPTFAFSGFGFGALAAAPESTTAATTSVPKSFDELSQDLGFFRSQQKFERFDDETRNRLRDLYSEIAAAPNAETLWRVADHFCAWVAAFPNDADRERFLALPVDERVVETRRRLDAVDRYFAARRKIDDSRRGEAFSEPNLEFDESPTVRALRGALPEDLRDENLRLVAEKYVAFSQTRVRKERSERSRDGILAFLKETSESELSTGLSEKARLYLSGLSEEESSSVFGLLVSLGLCEREERSIREARSSFQRRERGFGGARSNDFDSARPDFRGDPVRELAETLRSAPAPVRDYLTSLPAAEMRGYLWAAHWGFSPFSVPKNEPDGSNGSDRR